jgi:AraC-like DNA-binding protein
MLYFTPFILGSAEAKIEMVHSVMRDEDPFDIRLIENLKYVHGIIYVLLTIRLLRRHRSRLKDRFSSIERINLNWLRYLTIGIVFVWSVAILEWLVGLFVPDPLQTNPFTPIAVAVFVYAIGYMGLRQPAIFGIQSVTHTASGSFIIPPAPGDVGESPPAEIQQTAVSKYKKSGLSKDRADRILASLLSFMEEQKPFVRSTLTLQELSDELRISAHNLSEVINTRLGKNFFDFVNGFRVKEVQERLVDPRFNNLTILAIAQDAGFSSKSTFNTIFKKVTETTPSEYRRQFQNVS